MARDPRYDILFEPIRIGPVTAKNRFYQVPHCTGLGWLRPRMLAALRGIKAEGGWGVVCTEYCSIHPASDDLPHHYASLWDDSDVKAQALMTEAVHAHGALAGVELWFGGARTSNLYSREVSLDVASMPSIAGDPFQSRAMDKADIRELRRWHREAAKRAKQQLAAAKREKIEFQGNIAWFYHKEFARWAVEVWREHGMDPCYCPAGPEYNKRIKDKANWQKPIIASVSAHGTGKNLQGMRYQQVVQWPRSASLAEQMLGRMHRVGQEADEITCPILFMTAFDHLNFAATLVDALYVQQTTKQRQKLVASSYITRPKVMPPEVLRERGYIDRDIYLDDESRELLAKFLGSR